MHKTGGLIATIIIKKSDLGGRSEVWRERGGEKRYPMSLPTRSAETSDINLIRLTALSGRTGWVCLLCKQCLNGFDFGFEGFDF